MKFQTYVLLRILRSMLILLTAPLWVPIVGLAVGLLALHDSACRWRRSVRRDWERR